MFSGRTIRGIQGRHGLRCGRCLDGKGEAKMNRKMRKGIAFALLVFLLVTAFRGMTQERYDLDAVRIREDTVYLCNEIGIRVTGTSKEKETADWLMDTLRKAGFSEGETLYRVPFQGAKDLSSENVMAVCNPEHTGPLISIVAHYDSVATSVGARDNGASVAALLEIARYLGTENTAYPCQIRMIFLGSEENGYHGSAAYVASLTEEERNRHVAAFNMDISAASADEGAVLVCNTLGMKQGEEYVEGNFICSAEGAAVKAVRTAYRNRFGKELGGVFHFGESDHVSFHNAQLEAVNVCWRKVADGFPVLPDSYHKPEDLPEDLDYAGTVAASAGCILNAIQILCK